MSRYSIQWAWPLSMFFSQFLMMHWNIWKSKQNRSDIRLQHNLHSHWRMHMCIQQKLYDRYICTIYNVCHSKRDYKICRAGCNVRVSTGAWLWTKLWNSRPPHQWDAWSVALPWAATPRPSEQTTEARTACPTVSLEWKLCSYHVMLYYPFLISTFKVLQASNLKFSGWGCWIRWNLKIFASWHDFHDFFLAPRPQSTGKYGHGLDHPKANSEVWWQPCLTVSAVEVSWCFCLTCEVPIITITMYSYSTIESRV